MFLSVLDHYDAEHLGIHFCMDRFSILLVSYLGVELMGHIATVCLAFGRHVKLFSKAAVQFSHSVVSDSLRLHGLQHARLLCPLPTPGAYSNSCP